MRELIRTHGDFYDFVVVFTNFDFDRRGAIGFYTNVRDDVQGIGLPVVDNGDGFGSPERLQGFIDMGPIDQYRQAPFGLELGTTGFRTTLGILCARARTSLARWDPLPRRRRAPKRSARKG